MLFGAGLLWFVAGDQNIWAGACLKVGLVMAALWLALPMMTRRGEWGRTSWPVLFCVVAFVLVLTGKRVDVRIIISMLVGFAIAIMILRPKVKQK